MQDLFHFDWISMIILFGLIQALVIIYLFATKARFKAHKSIIYIICAISAILVESLFLKSGLMSNYPHFLNISAPFLFILGPLIFFYIKSQLNQKLTLRHKLWHALIFVFYFFYSFNFFLQSAAFKYNVYISSFHPNEEPFTDASIRFSIDPWGIQGWVVMEIISLHLFTYGCLCLYFLLTEFKKSPAISNITKKWLLYITVILILVSLVLFLSHGGVINGKVYFNSPLPKSSTDFLGITIMYLFTVFIVSNPDFFKLSSIKYSRSSLSKEYKIQKLQVIESLLKKEKIFLDPNFSLKMLAEKTGISMHHISQILNEELKSTFFQICNHYRISEAKRRLTEKDSFIKMEQLAFELGYKSKSTFFKAFKKETHLTPSKYCESVSS